MTLWFVRDKWHYINVFIDWLITYDSQINETNPVSVLMQIILQFIILLCTTRVTTTTGSDFCLMG